MILAIKKTQKSNRFYTESDFHFVNSEITNQGEKMKKKFVNRRRSRKGVPSFRPDRHYIEQAVAVFLEKGGRINHVEANEKSFENSWMINDVGSDVDEFLNGQ
jgi:hypothetical protein